MTPDSLPETLAGTVRNRSSDPENGSDQQKPATTPRRTIRISDEEWEAAKEVAGERNEDVSAVIRAALRRYVKRHQATRGKNA